MEYFGSVVALLGGVALFLYGMTLMSDGLKKVAGSKLEVILYRLTSNRVKGFALGTGVTAVIQSSCATSIMVVGFVNSGMMKLKQAISIILGSILGTSITGWIVCLSYLDSGAKGLGSILSTAVLTGIVAVIGVFFRMFRKGHTNHRIGDILMGFAILMFGMSAMGNAVKSMQDVFSAAIAALNNPFIGILLGIVFTAILQSASAAVGVLQALSVAGAMPFEIAMPILLGIGIGASVPVLFSAVSANTEGKRTAMVYLVSEVASVTVIGGLFYILSACIGFGSLMTVTMNPVYIAIANTTLRLIKMLLLLPFTALIEKTVTALVKEKASNEETVVIHLEERFITYPALAIEQSRTAINEMADVAKRSLLSALSLLSVYTPEGFQKVKEMEDIGDKYEDALGTYLVKLTGRDLTDAQNKDVSKFLHTISDFERISDHALNIAEAAREIFEKGVVFSDEGKNEIGVMSNAVMEIVETAVTSFINDDLAGAYHVEPLEELIDNLCDEMKLHHTNRIQKGLCTLHQGFVFNDLLTDFERISDHCSNLAVALIELDSDEFDTHKYLDSIKKAENAHFDEYYREYMQKYHFM